MRAPPPFPRSRIGHVGGLTRAWGRAWHELSGRLRHRPIAAKWSASFLAGPVARIGPAAAGGSTWVPAAGWWAEQAGGGGRSPCWHRRFPAEQAREWGLIGGRREDGEVIEAGGDRARTTGWAEKGPACRFGRGGAFQRRRFKTARGSKRDPRPAAGSTLFEALTSSASWGRKEEFKEGSRPSSPRRKARLQGK